MPIDVLALFLTYQKQSESRDVSLSHRILLFHSLFFFIYFFAD